MIQIKKIIRVKEEVQLQLQKDFDSIVYDLDNIEYPFIQIQRKPIMD